MKKIIILTLCLILVLGIVIYAKFFIFTYPKLGMEIKSVFENNAEIPVKYTCDGENISFPLKIENISENAKTLVLIIDDPDAPSKVWTHGVLFNIPVTGSEIEIKEGESIGEKGINDFGKLNYGGPCPPSGTHRYFIKVYALNKELDLKQGATKEQVESAMKNYVIDSAKLIGLYSR